MDHGNVCPTSYCMSNRTGTLAVAFCTSALGVPEQVCQAVLHSLRVTPVSACVRVAAL